MASQWKLSWQWSVREITGVSEDSKIPKHPELEGVSLPVLGPNFRTLAWLDQDEGALFEGRRARQEVEIRRMSFPRLSGKELLPNRPGHSGSNTFWSEFKAREKGQQGYSVWPDLLANLLIHLTFPWLKENIVYFNTSVLEWIERERERKGQVKEPKR